MVKVVQKLFTPVVAPSNEQEEQEPETVLDSSFVPSASFVDTDVDEIDRTHGHQHR